MSIKSVTLDRLSCAPRHTGSGCFVPTLLFSKARCLIRRTVMALDGARREAGQHDYLTSLKGNDWNVIDLLCALRVPLRPSAPGS